MSFEATILTAEFPRAVRGYATCAVDDFVRQVGERLDSLQDSLNDQIERSDRLASDLAGCATELAGYREKESALAAALVSTEQQRAAVRSELETERATAGDRARQVIESAESEADRILAHARRDAEELTSSAIAERSAIEQRIIALSNQYDETISAIRATLQSLAMTLPASGSLLPERPMGALTMTAVIGPQHEQYAEAA